MKKTLAVLSLTLMTAWAFADVSEQECIDKTNKIEEKLACLNGLTVKEVTSSLSGARQFEMAITQFVDHQNKEAGTFTQRLVLYHRGEAEPMVLQTSGYAIFSVGPAALTTLFKTNQIQVEHRFFENSVPNPVDWSKLDIKQSADDFHRITQAFRQIYKAKWVNTGASKGGMTSVFHRRFYPDDLDGTVADVAPLSFGTSDPRYIDWVENVGGAEHAECRKKLETLQAVLLQNRETLVPNLKEEYHHLGSADIGFEHAVIEASFAFWQYYGPSDLGVGCQNIPASGTTAIMDYLSNVNAPASYSDPSVRMFMPYYFQAATQLGNPGGSLKHLNELLKHQYSIDQYTPKGVQYQYTDIAMQDVETWVKEKSEKILFVYGEWDPWTAGAYTHRPEGDSHKFIVPGGNHRANVTRLPAAKKAEALAILSRWFNKQPVQTIVRGKTLDDLEFEARKKARLP